MTPLDVLAVGAHPDDVELGCGGTVALLARAGRRVGLLHLTGGEAGTRGTPEERRAEAEAAATALGAAGVWILDCGDAHFRHGREEEDSVIELLRLLRPELVLGPTPSDRHPDHGRAHRLVADACYYAGLAARKLPGAAGGLAPHRPAAVFSYMQHDPFEPSFVVDVTAAWEAKQRALDCYRSQLHQEGPAVEGERERPPTKVGSREFRLAVEGRARHFGLMIGAELGEPFWSRLPLAVGDAGTLLGLAPGGVR
jgi:bacillithiol biosynthesis deacetylase BshB1